MVQYINQHRGSLPVVAILGDMADCAIDDEFDVVYVTVSTFFYLLTQDRQAQCFANVAKRLLPGGRFVIDAFIPTYFPLMARRHDLSVRAITLEHIELSATLHDPSIQRIIYQEIRVDSSGIHMFPFESRYAWPSELDLMAKMAGMTLDIRYENWTKQPFMANSRRHVSVYQKQALR